MKKSIFFKIFSGYFLIAALLSTLILIFFFEIIRNYYIDTLAINLKNLGITLKLEITPFLEKGQFQKIDSIIKQLGKEINTRITIINPLGIVLADSEKEPKLMENHKNRPEIIEALNDKIGRSLRFSSTIQEEMLYIAMPIKKNGKILGILRVSLSFKKIDDLLINLKIKILQNTLIIIIISLFGAIILSRNLSKPIKDLVEASRKVASKNFDVKIFLKNEDEFKELADSFNYMTSQIKDLFSEVSLQKDELNTIISSIQEGLLLLDKEGRIILSNQSFKKFLQNNLIDGKFYWEVLRELKFTEFIKRIKDEKKNFIEEIELNGEIFLCSATFLNLKEEIILVLHDITEIKNLEKIKKDFIVNLSHELKTPLTAIKGFIETLEEEENLKNKHYLEIINKNTNKLINIVQDLLLLSKLESQEVKLDLEEVNLKNLLEDIFKIFEQRLKENKINWELSIENNLPLIKADYFKLEQMFINLIDNAVKFTEKGEIKISLASKNKILEIEIKDTGCGIPKEHLSRIFERFYVADKSHSRKLGGTGLGLSIVKHVVLLHNGEIKVESLPSQGTKFIINLPLNLS